MRRVLVLVGALAFAALPGVAAADVIFDQADTDDLAATLAEAYDAQGVCYGWSISVDNEGVPETSVGSNFGAGKAVADGDCAKSVELQASISWTPESSESEDSASYQVISTPSGPTTSDLDDLDVLSEDDLTSDDVDVAVYKAVAALPLLAADTGLASPIEASPAPESEAAGAAPTNSPGSDFWRESGMMLLWGAVLLLAGVAFGWYAIKSSRRPGRRRTIGPVAEQIPDTVPPEWTPGPVTETAPPPYRPPEQEAEPEPGPAPKSEAAPQPETAPESEPAERLEAAPEPEAAPRSGAAPRSDTAPEPEAVSEPEAAERPGLASGSDTALEPEATPEPDAAERPGPAPRSDTAPEPETAPKTEVAPEPETAVEDPAEDSSAESPAAEQPPAKPAEPAEPAPGKPDPETRPEG